MVPRCNACNCDGFPVPQTISATLATDTGTGANRWICPTCMEWLETDRATVPNSFVCGQCGATDCVVNREFHTVCNGCGSVVATGCDFDADERVRLLYKRVFYFNELISLFCLGDPPIPAELLDLLKTAYSKRTWPRLERAQVHELCRSVSAVRDKKIPSCFHVKLPLEYSRKFAAKTGRLLYDLRKYGEKWRRIKYELTGERPPIPSANCIDTLRMFIANVSRIFESIRHCSECPGTTNCHKHYPCRHNIINSNYILKKGFLFFYRGDRRNEEYIQFKTWLPQPNRSNRHEVRDKYWKPICRRLGWTYWE